MRIPEKGRAPLYPGTRGCIEAASQVPASQGTASSSLLRKNSFKRWAFASTSSEVSFIPGTLFFLLFEAVTS